MGWLSNLFTGAKNLFGGAGQALGGAIGNIGKVATPAFKGVMDMFGGSGGSNPFQSLMGGSKQSPAISPMKSSSPFSLGQGFSIPKVSGAMGTPGLSMMSPGFSGMSNPDDDKPKSKNFLQMFMDQAFPGGGMQGIAGLAIPAIGNMFAPKVKEIPDASSLSSVQALQNFKPGGSVSPEYQAMLGRETDRLKEQKVKELQNLYRNARPGTDYLTDTNYQSDLANINRQTEEVMADNLARAEGMFSQQEQQRLSELAQLDIYTLMAQTGLSAQEADNFKQTFSDIGNVFLTNATRKPEEDLVDWLQGRRGQF